MSMTAADRLDAIEARANAAMDTPWRVSSLGDAVLDRSGLPVARVVIREDADFIAHTPTDVPWLIGQVRWLLGELAAAVADNEKKDAALRAVLDLHREARNDVDHTPPCPHCHGEPGIHECGCWADEKWPTVCAVCMEGAKGASVEWPCPTVRAIEGALA